jgi:hypothetical protein
MLIVVTEVNVYRVGCATCNSKLVLAKQSNATICRRTSKCHKIIGNVSTICICDRCTLKSR